MQRFDLNQIPHSPWKNGGGSTREIACWPQGAGMDSFGWRVSVATIAQAGPFSAFPGIDHALQQRWQPFAFSGDAALDCSLLGGTSTDFNVMTRRGQWSAEVSIHDAAVQPGRGAAGLCLVLQGGFAQGQTVLQAGQGLWWDAAEDAEPLLPGDAHSRLVLVSLHQAA